jgi:hypothetical protein
MQMPLTIAALVCGVWAIVSILLVTRFLDVRGVPTPFPLIGLFAFRNLRRYREITRRETGKTGPLFASYIISINAALILVVIALVSRIR